MQVASPLEIPCASDSIRDRSFLGPDAVQPRQLARGDSVPAHLPLPYVSRRWLSRYSCSHARVVRRTVRGPAAIVTVLRRPARTAVYSGPEFVRPASLLASTSVI